MFKTVLALTLLSFNAMASVDNGEIVPLPFGFDTGYVESDKNIGYGDTIIRLVADLTPVEVYDIKVDDEDCKPYKKIPKNFIVPKGDGFVQRFYATNGKDCMGMQFVVKTDKGEFHMDSGEE